MIDTELLKILCCPATRQALREATSSELEALNGAIGAGTVKNKAGEQVREALSCALVTLDGKILYPVRQDIPVMLIDESILLP